MVNLTRIYTRTGDDGTTALGDMSRALKTDLRLEAFADVDEANSSIGVAIAMGNLDQDVKDLLIRVQNDLFDVGADLATPVGKKNDAPQLRVLPGYVDELEKAIDQYAGEELVAKYELLKANTTGKLKGIAEYKKALNFVALSYPNNIEGKQAEEIIRIGKEDSQITIEQKVSLNVFYYSV